MKKWKILYIILFFALCMIPSVCLLFYQESASTENRTLAVFPSPKSDTGWNFDYMKELGTWFEDHFAFRKEFVTLNDCLMAKVFGVSANESVIAGKNGWLYYKDSLKDYQGTDLLKERQLFDIAHTLSMVQDYAGEKGVRFAFVIAPNKNSLYGDNMPYYYRLLRNETNNRKRLKKFLKSEHISYVDLFTRLGQESDTVLYHERDSHWNNRGAAIAAEEIFRYLDREHPSYVDRDYNIRQDFEGDLDAMLFPAAIQKEKELYYVPSPEFEYIEEVESNFEPKIHTVSKSGKGSLVMYRDSFGNALLPFMAEPFSRAYFSRGVPYQLKDLDECEADTLVIERAERFLPDMAENPPVMPAPRLAKSDIEAARGYMEITDMERTVQGDYTKIRGTLPQDKIQTYDRIAVYMGQDLYEAFPYSDENGKEGFLLYVKTEQWKEDNPCRVALFQ